jgi:hypothetical protein
MRVNTLASSCKPDIWSTQSSTLCRTESYFLPYLATWTAYTLIIAGHIQRTVKSKMVVVWSCTFILHSILRPHMLLNFLFLVCKSTRFMAAYSLFFGIAAKQQAFDSISAYRTVPKLHIISCSNIDSNNVKVSRQIVAVLFVYSLQEMRIIWLHVSIHNAICRRGIDKHRYFEVFL